MTIYSICFWIGLVFAVISAVSSHLFGGGHDAHVDIGTGGHSEAGFDHTGMPGLSVFSPTVIFSFLTAFGGLGNIFSMFESTRQPLISASLALAGAAVIAGGVFWLFNTVIARTQSSSESRVSTLAGLTATIVTPIPENGMGEIAYVQSGIRHSAPARSEAGKPIAAGQVVKITRIVGGQFYVTTDPG